MNIDVEIERKLFIECVWWLWWGGTSWKDPLWFLDILCCPNTHTHKYACVPAYTNLPVRCRGSQMWHPRINKRSRLSSSIMQSVFLFLFLTPTFTREDAARKNPCASFWIWRDTDVIPHWVPVFLITLISCLGWASLRLSTQQINQCPSREKCTFNFKSFILSPHENPITGFLHTTVHSFSLIFPFGSAWLGSWLKQ